MAKVIEFHLRDPLGKTERPIPIEERGKLIELTKETLAVRPRTDTVNKRGDASQSAVPYFYFGCF